jgi:hypothetical protein
MSTRTLMEINHDFLDDIFKKPSGRLVPWSVIKEIWRGAIAHLSTQPRMVRMGSRRASLPLDGGTTL